MQRLIRLLLTFALAFVSAAVSLPAQQAERGRVPVTIALVDALPRPDAPFLILRRVETTPHDVIVLPPGADAAHLSEAVYSLLVARQQGGDRAARAATLRLRPRTQAPRQGRPVLAWAPRVLADLHVAQPQRVPGVGSVRAVEVWLPRRSRVPSSRAGR